MKKKYYLVALLLMLVGFAAVSTTLYLNGSTSIISNDDFKVYYSDAKVNGVQDLSIVDDDTHLSFTTELDTLGQTYVIEYDVTNSSKSYDADLEMVCTGGDEYLSVSNVFDDVTNLPATETRVGTLTLTLAKTYVGDAYDVDITCTITANAVERTSLGTGTPASPVEPDFFPVGKKITLAGEPFNVISKTEDTVTLLASNVLGKDYRQTTSTEMSIINGLNVMEYGIKFLNNNGWEYSPGPKDINIQNFDGGVKTYVNEYVSFLQIELESSDISGNIITVEELNKLGCTINEEYNIYLDMPANNCNNSKYYSWLVNGQGWWTRSADSYIDGYNDGTSVITISGNGYAGAFNYTDFSYNGARPTITISKDVLNKYLGNEI